jgi:hypothetical protein
MTDDQVRVRELAHVVQALGAEVLDLARVSAPSRNESVHGVRYRSERLIDLSNRAGALAARTDAGSAREDIQGPEAQRLEALIDSLVADIAEVRDIALGRGAGRCALRDALVELLGGAASVQRITAGLAALDRLRATLGAG